LAVSKSNGERAAGAAWKKRPIAAVAGRIDRNNRDMVIVFQPMEKTQLLVFQK
jgi:hypothetical protein